MFNDFFKKISSSFNSPKGDSVLGIDIGSSSIKVVQLKRLNEQAILQTYGEIALGPYGEKIVGQATKLDPAVLSQALMDLLKESNVSTNSSALSIPMRSSMVSVFDMPSSVDKRRLAEMIPIEARKYIPVPIDEVALDWFIIPKIEGPKNDERFKTSDSSLANSGASQNPLSLNPSKEISESQKGDGKIETMVVAIHNDDLNDYSLVVKNAGLDASFFEIEMFASSRAVLDYSILTPVMIVDIGAGSTKIYVAERGIIRSTHTIGKGSQDLTLAISRGMNLDFSYAEKLKRKFGENTPDQDMKIAELMDLIFNPIFQEANSILVQFQTKYRKNIAKVIMIGGGSLLKGIEGKAQKFFSVPAEIGLPFDKVQKPAFLDPVLNKNGVMFAGAIGLAIRKLQELD